MAAAAAPVTVKPLGRDGVADEATLTVLDESFSRTRDIVQWIKDNQRYLRVSGNVTWLVQNTHLFDRLARVCVDEPFVPYDGTNGVLTKHPICMLSLCDGPGLDDHPEVVALFVSHVTELTQNVAAIYDRITSSGAWAMTELKHTVRVLLAFATTVPSTCDQMLEATPDTVKMLTQLHDDYTRKYFPGTSLMGRLCDILLDKQSRGHVKACRQSE